MFGEAFQGYLRQYRGKKASGSQGQIKRHTGRGKYGWHVGGEAMRSGKGKRRPGLEQTQDNRQGE